MSAGSSLSGSAVIFSLRDKVIVALISGSIIMPFAIFIGWGIYSMHTETAQILSEEALAKYPAGTIVKTKIGGFRGIVTSPDCYHGCSYWVRFPTASMQPQRVSEYEIQPWTDGKR